MNIRQQLYKKYRFEGMSKYAAARKAGFSHAYATQAKNIENRINMEQLAEMAGLTDNAIINYINEALKAQKVISADIFIKDENGKLTVNKNSNDWIEYPDWHARAKFLEILLRVIGKLKTGEINVTQNTVINGKDKLTTEDRIRQQRFMGLLRSKFKE